MKKLSYLPLLLALTLPIVACGDDGGGSGGEYDGLYELTVHQTKDDCSADTWADEVISEPYFYLEAQTMFSMDVIAWMDCTGTTIDTCSDSPDLSKSFARKDGLWQQHMTVSSYAGGECFLNYRRAVLEKTDTGISWEGITKSGTVTVANEDECEPELAEQREDELECSSMSYFEAERL